MFDQVHVMIVEDERIVALHLRQQLTRLGYKKISVHSAGQPALDAMMCDAPDVILMDIHIDGDLDGIETAASIPPDFLIPVIYLSAYSEDPTLERARKTQPYGFLLKPFSERELHATIQMAVERRQVEYALRQTEERLSLAMAAANLGCWEIDVKTRLMRGFGLETLIPEADAEGFLGNLDDFLARVIPSDRDTVRAAFEYAIMHGNFYDVMFRREQGGGISLPRWFRAQGKIFAADRRNTERLIGIIQDVTDQHLSTEKLRQAKTVFQTTQDGILILDHQLNIVSANPAYCAITGSPPDEIIGKPPYMVADGSCSDALQQDLQANLKQRGYWHREIDTRRQSGDPISVHAQIIAVSDDNGNLTHYVAMISDRTAIRQAEQELQYLAQYDGLTALPNRLLANDRLQRAIDRAETEGTHVACLFLDLDEFKNVNDMLGHDIGDQVLMIAARRIRAAIAKSDTVARLGGDEFLIIVEDVYNAVTPSYLAARINAELRRPFHVKGQEITMSASIGISIYPENGKSTQDLVRLADTAMYAAKAKGRRTFAYYKSEMTENTAHYMTRSLQLRHGLEKGELELFYQPQLSAQTGEMMAVEALIRWNHPTEGLLMPADIIPIAEQSGLIVEIGDWVLRQACRQACQWQKDGRPALRMAVNVSARQLHAPHFATTVKTILTQTGLAAEYLELEVTESMIQDAEDTIQTLHDLLALGVSIAIDDFGTGYSCLSSLKKLPIRRIKIDRAFIIGIPDDSENTAMTEAIIAMAHKLGLRITAEGVEQKIQHDFLAKQGCDELQGFLFKRPVPASQVFDDTTIRHTGSQHL
ncbi:EAL domain-containing protein [Thalassospira sp.]|uniref:two-component system response regulator n=1 Tax=Thalassospira sp. TaxID=1912094 RepID=UPI002733BDAF|nr:EAL domain-containing protein [Thalassospira sp.]MDP2697610.1 EAL domain-containing protein [Thalassospira sp.]